MSDALKPLFGGLPDAFDRLARRAEAAATLTEQVRAALPEALRAHVIGANARGKELVGCESGCGESGVVSGILRHRDYFAPATRAAA